MLKKDLMVLVSGVIFTLFSATALSAALERSGQPINILFEPGRQLEFSHNRILPNASGRDTTGGSTGNVTGNYNLNRFAIKTDIGPSRSVALQLDQPWGANLKYDDASETYGGTEANASSQALTLLLHQSINAQWGLFSGLRLQKVEGDLTLEGDLFGFLAGYRVENKPDEALGYVAGVSYQQPALGMLFSLAYFSEIKHKLEANESITTSPTTTKLVTPQAINIDFRTGISPTTLLYAAIRWVQWSEFVFDPEALPVEVANFEDNSVTYTLGVGKRLSPAWAGLLIYKHELTRDSVNSLFSPVNGYKLLSSSLIYTFDNKAKLTVGVSYSELGDSSADLAAGERIDFTGNDSLAYGIKVNLPF